jgi:hypothetical protein
VVLEPVLNELGAGWESLEGSDLRLSFLEVGAWSKILLAPSRLRQVPRQLNIKRYQDVFIAPSVVISYRYGISGQDRKFFVKAQFLQFYVKHETCQM